MADKKNTAKPETPVGTKKKKRSNIWIVLLIFLLLLLACGGFIAGVYLKYIDVQQIGQKMKLYDYPLIGSYFTRPVTNFEIVDLPPETSQNQQSVVPPTVTPLQTPSAVPGAPTVQPTDAEKDKLLQKAKQEEAKRISKLARLYGGMKPEEAVSIMNQLDDSTVLSIFGKMEEEQVSKIMAMFDPGRSARLTQDMLKGKQ